MKERRNIRIRNLLTLVMIGIILLQFVLFIIQGSRINQLRKDIDLLKGATAEEEISSNSSGSAVIPSSSTVPSSSLNVNTNDKDSENEINTSNDSDNESLQKGVFYHLENNYGEDINSSNDQYYCINTDNGRILFCVPYDAKFDEISDNAIKYHISNDWISISYLYEIDETIKDIYDTERKVNSITSNLPNTYPEEYGSVYPGHFISNYYNPDLQSVWEKSVTANGASYFYESSHKSNNGMYAFDALLEESFVYIDNIAIHEKIQIDYYNYLEYYNSFDTEMKKREVESERDIIYNIYSHISVESYNAENDKYTPVFFQSPSNCNYFTDCLSKMNELK